MAHNGFEKIHRPHDTKLMIDLSISDGTKDLIEMASLMGESVEKLSKLRKFSATINTRTFA